MPSLIRFINGLFSGGPYYVRIGRNRLSVRDVAGEGQFDDEPIVALSDDSPPKVLAIGRAAKNTSARWINPFDHPRIILGDFTVAEALITHSFLVVSRRRHIRSSPIVVIHPIDMLTGGLSSIERRALMELAYGAGAREVHIWEGAELSDAELINHAYRRAT